MDRIVTFGRWTLRVDVDRTRALYDGLDAGFADLCRCQLCKNYASARKRVYDRGVRNVLGQFGIDHRMESDVVYTQRLAAGRHLYRGAFHFVGAIHFGRDAAGDLSPPDGAHSATGCAARDGYVLSFSDRPERVPASHAAASLVQVDFEAVTPWLLPVDEPA